MPIHAHSIVSYFGPEQSRSLPMMHALNWHEEINMGIFALTVDIYTVVPAAIMKVHMTR